MAQFATSYDAMNALEAVINGGDAVSRVENYSDDYDLEAIFDEVFIYRDGYDEERGIQNLNKVGYDWKDIEDDEFWKIVEKHEIN